MLEAQQVQCEEDKVTKDNQIRTLKDEMMHQVWFIYRETIFGIAHAYKASKNGI